MKFISQIGNFSIRVEGRGVLIQMRQFGELWCREIWFHVRHYLLINGQGTIFDSLHRSRNSWTHHHVLIYGMNILSKLPGSSEASKTFVLQRATISRVVLRIHSESFFALQMIKSMTWRIVVSNCRCFNCLFCNCILTQRGSRYIQEGVDQPKSKKASFVIWVSPHGDGMADMQMTPRKWSAQPQFHCQSWSPYGTDSKLNYC
jgi:hypothetical protein